MKERPDTDKGFHIGRRRYAPRRKAWRDRNKAQSQRDRSTEWRLRHSRGSKPQCSGRRTSGCAPACRGCSRASTGSAETRKRRHGQVADGRYGLSPRFAAGRALRRTRHQREGRRQDSARRGDEDLQRNHRTLRRNGDQHSGRRRAAGRIWSAVDGHRVKFPHPEGPATNFGFVRNWHHRCSKSRKRDLECGVSKDEGAKIALITAARSRSFPAPG